MEKVVKYARTVLNSIEKRPQMFGVGRDVELQYLLALEFLVIGLGHPRGERLVREEYSRLREELPGPGNLSLSDREMCVEDVIDALKTIRTSFDIDVELV